ncbi:hypothetical protein [Sphingosinicella humi]|uniref:Uncharacterized protein n=1 Tax=Allosphingosinicella humi TaxID=2068657 RepID=A0A2U2J477_9SPHN|nr:hypothetical protein [Sphingosinicella humi]PWG03140.1 hypothetical protein DF286_09895 [Sphingosinicella humi]
MTFSIRRRSAVLGLALLAAGCTAVPKAGGGGGDVGQPAPPTFSTAGLENVMGKTAHILEAQFGEPDLDIREGAARKLQFASQVCVLDAYLYPPERGEEPVVRYVDARLPDGRDVDRASCAAALTRRQEAR